MFRQDPKKTSLNAIAAMGMPVEFAIQAMLLARRFGVAIAIHENTANHLYEFPCAPKPSNIKANTGNWGLTKGVITKDPNLGRHLADGTPANDKVSPPKDILFMQHKVTLREVFAGLAVNEYVLVSGNDLSPAAYTQQTGQLLIKSVSAPNTAAKDIVFNIDLTHPATDESVATLPLYKQLRQKPLQTPDFWLSAWGDFNAQLNKCFPLNYQASKNSEFSPVDIYAINVNGKTLPVATDFDLLWMTQPAATTVNQTLFHQPYDSSNSTDREQLHLALQELIERRPDEKIQSDTTFLSQLGTVTAFEAYLMLAINQRFAISIPHLAALLQHGCENRSPFTPKSLDGQVLHIWEGGFVLTTSEKECVDFVLNTPGYLKNNVLSIHPKWNMALWGKVIEKQLALGQPVADTVKDAYRQHTLATQRVTKTNNVALFQPCAREEKSNTDFFQPTIAVK